MEGRRVYGANWKELYGTHLHAYMGVLILAGVYRSRDESTASLWDAETGRAIFRATMSLKTFHIFSRVIRFDNRETRPGRCEQDKLAAIRDVWDRQLKSIKSGLKMGLMEAQGTLMKYERPGDWSQSGSGGARSICVSADLLGEGTVTPQLGLQSGV
ncbi:hypothetical protein AAFF_G00365600 [Aldrovandia affinis]|uniref:PiggyBac transposable element-derived protein domain-containing protein n=1 Tax=Aldrovandia affinis TaxID=143900 RepID=A0AAD7WML9_9TELE|nr:hypothetical protein AAFF_G00365600 [Aldrovandia affinis]